MGLTHLQGASGSTVSLSAFNVVLANNPVPGNVLCAAIAMASNFVTLTSVADSNGNAFTITPNSPSVQQAGAGHVYLAYRLVAAANATKTITFTCNTGDAMAAWVDEFTVSGGTMSFDKDARANTGTGNTTVSTPTVTPAFAGSLLFGATAVGGTVSAPTAGGTLGVWTGAGGGITAGDMAEYLLSSGTGSTAVQYTQSPSAGWSGVVMSLKFTPKNFRTLTGMGV